ncbi:MAG: hypothetical protein WC205_08190 [Opitutaceae bacterium]|jgi:hypothetical protein
MLLFKPRYSLCVLALFGATHWCLPPIQAGIAFKSSAKGNVFTADNGEVSLLLDSTPQSGGQIIVRDELDNVLQTVPIDTDADTASVQLHGKGFYRIEARINRDGAEPLTLNTTAAVIGPKLDDAVRMTSGIGLWNVQGDATLVAAAGAKWNRRMLSLRNLKESELLPVNAATVLAPPPVDPTGLVNVGVFSFGLPLWAMQLPSDYVHKGFGNPLYPPKSPEILRQVVKSYLLNSTESLPSYIELYNEPEWKWTGTNEGLVDLFKQMTSAIREVRPDVKILGPGFSSIRIHDKARIDFDTLNQHGLFDVLDGVVTHAYVDGTPPEGEFIDRVIELQDFLVSIGKPHLPIHLTEFGWCTRPGTWQKPVDSYTQARYLSRSLTLLMSAGIENATYFAYIYKNQKSDGETSFSIANQDHTPLPAYAAFANAAHWLAGAESMGRWLQLTPSTYCALFRKKDRLIGIIWDTEGQRELILPVAPEHAEDMMGRAVNVPANGALTISPSPLFLDMGEIGPDLIVIKNSIRIIRGKSASLARSDTGWIVPAPLTYSPGVLTAPSDAAVGDYLLLSKAGSRWETQPVSVISPLEVTSKPSLVWPLNSDTPRLSVDVVSQAEVAMNTSLSTSLKGSRDYFLKDTPVEPNNKMTLELPLKNIREGQRYQGELTVDSIQDDWHDQVRLPLDFTVLTARFVQNDRPDWSQVPAVDFSAWDPMGVTPIAPENGSASVQSVYSPKALILRIQVRDDIHVQDSLPSLLWQQDSIQIGLDPDVLKSWEANDLFGLKGHRAFEYGVALNGHTPMTWRWISYVPELPSDSEEPRLQPHITRVGDVTTYQITFPWSVLGLKAAPAKGSAIGIALVVHDVDSASSQKHSLRLFRGVAEGKNPDEFGPLWLR